MIKNCVYFCEGPCEEALIKALQKAPALIAAGRPRPLNVIQNVIPNSVLLQIKQGTTVVFVFDTDKEITDKLQKSIELVKKHCPQSKIVFLIQVKNLEDELVRCTDVKKVTDLTQSQSVRRDLCDSLKTHTTIGGINALNVFVKKPFITRAPDSARNEDSRHLWLSGELFEYYYDWLFHDCKENIFDCNSGGKPHKHCMDTLIAQKV